MNKSPHLAKLISEMSSYFNLSGDPTKPFADSIIFGLPNCLELDSSTHCPTGRVICHPSFTKSDSDNTSRQQTDDGGWHANVTSTDPIYDDCFILDENYHEIPLDTRSRPLKKAVTLLADPTDTPASPSRRTPATATGPEGEDDRGKERPQSSQRKGEQQRVTGPVKLEIWTTEPAFQVYTGDGLDDVPSCKEDDFPGFQSRAGIAIEPGRYMNCAGRPEWQGQCLMRRGDPARSVYGARTRWMVYFRL